MAKGASKYSYSVRGETMIFTFNDPGNTRLELDTSKFTPRQVVSAKMHGAKQKIIDSFANKGLADSVTTARRMIDGMRRGGWGMIGLDVEALTAAIVNVTGFKPEDVAKKVEAADEVQLETWANNAKIAAFMSEFDAKRKREAAAKDTAKFEFNL